MEAALQILSRFKRPFFNRMKWENEEKSTVFYRGFGQEFILDIEKNPNVKKWAINLIKKHG